MKPIMKKVFTLLAATAIGATTVPHTALLAQAASSPEKVAAALSQLTNQEIQAAIAELNKLGIMNGDANGEMGTNRPLTRAELATLLVREFGLDDQSALPATIADASPNAWFYADAAEVVGLGIMQTDNGAFHPKGTVSGEELAQTVSKALKRDIKSVQHWMSSVASPGNAMLRGETAYVLQMAHKALPSEHAKPTSIRSLNAITLIVTFDKPLTTANEAFDIAKTDFVFTHGLTLTNMPRLKTGSVATYIVPTSVQQTGATYDLAYKGQAAGSFVGQGTKIDMTEARQVTNDTFEIEALKANGIMDYGYIISAYSGGRGANAFVLDDHEQAGGKTYQIISSMQARQVTVTPEGGAPIVAKYVPFTQSTDGKQEPKFRLPEGQVLTPGLTYTVTSDWANLAHATFVAKTVEPLELASATAVSETSIEVTLAQDPQDELFSGRSVVLTAPNGDQTVATYKYSSRKGAVGVFDLANGAKLTKATTYTVKPIGDWSKATGVVSLMPQ
ncbi:S-layer homology domain-containing protein [Paenibacillus sp. BC26]|uniref:S-layer homology domain-containing protein n=1 Tax=Paenibacillus sp. BC26 TaxID=1881032 RepID=UPI0008E5031B|nr:S-layer homology domain-containing protein [Paenibacillus sp. BC26]SFT27309.1 S-layer homology domain-containing protein [Paenibacillus sp. BC26]